MARTFGSVCSGIEAASLAFGPLGWKAAWFSEIEPFPSAVLAHHYPEVPNLGDMTTLPERVRAGEAEAPDMLCGGTPCQAFSVAGNRESLADARGNLTVTFCELADAIDDVRSARGGDPCVVFWENVPGVLSTSDNAFGCFLGALVGAGAALVPGRNQRWTDAGVVAGPRRVAAWRVLDAQFFGLAQRRRRVFVVAGAGAGFDPAAVLLERQGVPGHPAARLRAWQETAAGASRSPDVGLLIQGVDLQNAALSGDKAGTIQAEGQAKSNRGYAVLAFDPTQITSAVNRSNPKPGDPCHTLAKGQHAPAIAFSRKDHGADATTELAPTLRAMGHSGSHANAGGQMAVAFQTRGSNIDLGQDVTGTLAGNCDRASGVAPCVAFNARQDPDSWTERTGPLDTHGRTQAVLESGRRQPPATAGVRRLTPGECEALQGFPRGFTRIPWRGRPAEECPDGPRYKAIGNSWAVDCVAWIAGRLDAALEAA
jgi:DNA (cytosine-5)-methyltransferase 1